MPEGPTENPFVGPRPFESDDGPLFFGRNREIRELLSLIVSSRIVLLYSASGAGKTSLLNAGVIPLLEGEEGFEVLPPARVRGAGREDDGAAGAANVYTQGVLSNWTRELGGDSADADGRLTLARFLAGRPHARDANAFETPRALVFDQFEELFTVAPERWKQREPFLAQLAEALEADPLLRVVIAMREDYVAQLDPYARLVPGGLRTRFRLERLGPEAALRAVTGPLATTRRSFLPGVAESLVDDLLTFHVDTGTGESVKVEGEFVEPVQLQVVCRSLWSQLPPNVAEIKSEHLVLFGDVDEALARYYDNAVRAAVVGARTREGRLRRAIEESFITKVRTRGTAIREEATTGEVPNAAVDELESRHVVRAERRAGARWYELTHDRLIEPIQASNRRYREVRQRRRRRWQGAALALAVLIAVPTGLAVRQNQLDETEAASSEVDALKQVVRGLSNGTLAQAFVGHDDIVANAEISPDGKRVLTSSYDGTARLWDVATGRALDVLGTKDGPRVEWSAFSRDGRLFATAGMDRTARTWDAATLRPVTVLRGHTDRVATVAFRPDAQQVVTASDDGTARIWRLRDSKVVRVLHTGEDDVYSAQFDPSGRRIVTGGSGATVLVWDASSGRRLGALRGHKDAVGTVVFSPDGRLIATACVDGTAWLWDARTFRRVAVLPRHSDVVYTIAFDSSGTRVVTASADGEARVSNVPTGKPVAILSELHTGGVTSAAFSPDSKLVVTGGIDTTALLWKWTNPANRVK